MFAACCCVHDDNTEAITEASRHGSAEEPKFTNVITKPGLDISDLSSCRSLVDAEGSGCSTSATSALGPNTSSQSLGWESDYMGASSSTLTRPTSSSASVSPKDFSPEFQGTAEESQQDGAPHQPADCEETQQDGALDDGRESKCAASKEEGLAQYGPGDFNRLLQMGKLFEAYALLETCRNELDPKRVKWLEEVMPLLLKATEYVPEESKDKQAAAAGSAWISIDCDKDCKVDLLRHGDSIKFRTAMELPTSMEHVLAINVEIDLNSQWMPFSPKVIPTHSELSASLLVHMCFKIPVLPGHREIYTYRMCVDCLTPCEGSKRLGLPRGIMFVDVSPDCWKSGGSYLGEFKIPPKERWTSRDKAQMQVAFWEPLTAASSRLTMFGEVVFNVPKMLVPDSTLQWLVKQVAKSACNNLKGLFKDMVRYGYQNRIDLSSNLMYQTLRQEAADYFAELYRSHLT